jgi:sulfotransferase family protein
VTSLASHRLPQPRLNGLKRRIPRGVKDGPKALQAAALTGVARRVRRTVEPDDAVLVASTIRSGSTWLFEMLASDRALLPVFEPFHPTHNPHLRPYVDELGYLAVPGAADGRATLGGIVAETLAGRRLTRWSASRAPRRRLRTAPRTLVKEVRLQRALHWLTDIHPVPTVVLVRHPCAMVESALRSPREWLRWPELRFEAVLERQMPWPLPAGLAAQGRAALLAGLWALDVAGGLEVVRRNPRAVLVTYEDLVDEPAATVERLGRSLGLDDLAAEPERLSYMTSRRSPLHDADADPLTMWTGRLDRVTTETVLRIVHEIGIDLYSDDPRPYPERLEAAIQPVPEEVTGDAHEPAGTGGDAVGDGDQDVAGRSGDVHGAAAAASAGTGDASSDDGDEGVAGRAAAGATGGTGDARGPRWPG